MAAFKEIRDFFGEIIVPQLNELKTTLALVNQGAEGIRDNISVLQAEVKELRQEQKGVADRLSRLEGNFEGAAERIRLEVVNELLKAQVSRQAKRQSKSLPPNT